MDRRSFLKAIAALGATAAFAPLPLLGLPAAADWEKGGSLHILHRRDLINQWGEFFIETADQLAAEARLHLELGTRFEVRAALPTDFGRSQSFAWYANSDMQKQWPWARHRVKVGDTDAYVQDGGYYLLLRDIA
jgi:FtsP/CotA-like multicopper oxidase with cupredoxin domain